MVNVIMSMNELLLNLFHSVSFLLHQDLPYGVDTVHAVLRNVIVPTGVGELSRA